MDGYVSCVRRVDVCVPVCWIVEGAASDGEESRASGPPLEDDDDKSWVEEDDPDRLWCVCRQPFDNRFMICCDRCEEWYHGDCVGITRKRGAQMEVNNEEYICSLCKGESISIQNLIGDEILWKYKHKLGLWLHVSMGESHFSNTHSHAHI